MAEATEQAPETGGERAPFGVVLGRNVRRVRLEQGLSQAEFAGLLSAFGPTWSRDKVIALETGKRESVTLDELCQLSGCLHAPLAALFEGSEEVPLGTASVVDLAALRRALEQNEYVRLTLDAFESVEAIQAQVDQDFFAFEASQRLRVPLRQVREAAQRAFGRTASRERDALVAEMSEDSPIEYRRRDASRQVIGMLRKAVEKGQQ